MGRPASSKGEDEDGSGSSSGGVSRESGAAGSSSRVSIAQLVNGHGHGHGEAAAVVGVDHTMVEAAQTLDALRDDAGRTLAAAAAAAAAAGGGQFMQRVQAIPLVNSALGMYDRSRQSSAIIRVGSDVIESGVRKMYQPLAKRID
ncbi:hypothetical protein LPJ56_004336, partial [Coemansia sp. RSA 2599]